MLSLAELQAGFAAALTDPALAVPAGLRQPAQRRFDVHRNNRAAGLIDVLEAAFPVVRRLVGAEFFKAAAQVYIDREPPRSPVLLLYGQAFGAFLDGFAPAAGVPYLGDVARLEWARIAAYHAADAEPLSVTRLASVPEASLPGLRFALHPSLQLLRSRFPVASLWAATSGTDAVAAVDMTRGEEIAVLRPMLSIEVRVLPPGGHAFIAALAAGMDLEAAAEAVLAAAPGSNLAAHLQGLFALGAVSALVLPTPQQDQAAP
jgi:hypothetical protein